ncbi:centrosomal protein of 55 kDa [Hyperolius riggenbachi]|uniref:centrosomal protein of 55 kDa n=1 Tax=Hyperolius riggenbachi TaxID=752182 RepID=UPI0035A3C2A1
MTSKIITNKLGLKPALLKSDNNVDKLKKENAALKKKLEDSSKSKMSDGERNRLMEKILDLETHKVKSGQDLSRQAEIIQHRNEALNQKNKGQLLAVDKEARKMENVSKEIRKQMPEVPPRKVTFQSSVPQAVQDTSKESAPSNTQILEAQLKDALEKNQQWLVYDQQRETFVQGLMARIFELEQQVANSKETQQRKENSSNGKDEEMQKYYNGLLASAKKDLEGERQISAQLNSELSETRLKLEEKKKEAADLSTALKSLSENERQQREDDRRRMKEKMQRSKSELDVYREMYEEEKRKTSELCSQMESMKTSLHRQQEDQRKVASLEQQIQRCTSDLENEKIDRQSVQHQLCKVLKELRKTQEQITKLEPGKRDIYFIEKPGNFASEFEDKLTMREQHPSSKPKNLLDESFLECPQCKAVYPTSQHRELLAHIDFCTR